MNKKKIIIILIVAILFFVIIRIFPKNIKVKVLYGSKECTEEFHILTDDMSENRCKLCFEKFIGSSSKKICNDCANELGRCSVCVKIRKK